MVTAIPNLMAADEAAEPPTMEMLDFLLEWETEDGQWVDPVALESPEWQESDPETVPAKETGERLHD